MRYYNISFPIPVFKQFIYCSEEDIKVGCRVRVSFGNKLSTGYVTQILPEDTDKNYKIKKIKKVIDQEPLITPGLMKLASVMSKYYIASLGEVLSTILPASLLPTKRKVKQSNISKKVDSGYLLSEEQKKALTSIKKSCNDNKYDEFLIHGVTDSGKTEVYLQLTAHLIDKEKQVIILVPEISITTQLIQRFEQRFGRKEIGVWHSRVSRGKKLNYLRRMKNNEISILIGTRSAVFAPFNNLGSIIIDDQHDSSYKEKNAPYYDARWVAEKRCQLENAVLVMGSATPDIEVFHKVEEDGINYLPITDRIHQSKFPEITVVDMKKEYEIRTPGAIFSKTLLDSIEDTLEKGRQCILFLNRRGYYSHMVCKSCGQDIKCDNCNISMVYHYDINQLMCHWCGRKKSLPVKCRNCGGEVMKYTGFGTQRAEKALNKIFPFSNTVRMDLDTTSKKGSSEKIFKDFKQKKYDILVGTQIIAKGWDFSDVDLVGVLNSDIGLMMPDFRAAEKTYLLLRQVQGRTGRGKERGEIIVQTFNPKNYAIQMLFEQDYRKFYEKEIEIRKSSGYPPFSKLINIISSHKNKNTAKSNICDLKEMLDKKEKNIDILGPSPAIWFKIRGRYRWQLLIKYKESEKVKKYLKEFKKNKKYTGKIKMDVDPQEML
ncbi:MAG: replication restart helicase PriA [Atribacterota bacterium]